MNIKVTFLGTGTSTGVPSIACDCPTCISEDPRDKRLRCSLLLESGTTSVVVDTSPDFRQQMLFHKVKKLDAVVYTHHHFDHIGGYDDTRIFNFRTGKPLPLYLTDRTFIELRRTFIYAFEEPEQEGGGVPAAEINIIDSENFPVGDILFEPVKLMHGRLETLGFRINNFAYCTDTNKIPAETLYKLDDLDVLILDALRYEDHTTHFNIEQAIVAADEINAKKTYFIHMNHDIKHSTAEKNLPENMYFAYDNMVLNI